MGGLEYAVHDVLQLGAMSVKPPQAIQLDFVGAARAFNTGQELDAAPNKIHGDRLGGPGGQSAPSQGGRRRILATLVAADLHACISRRTRRCIESSEPWQQ